MSHSTTSNNPVSIRRESDTDVTLEHGALKLKIDAHHGARIVSFSSNNMEVLTQPGEHAENFGSTLWDAPQTRWGWPPPPTLDSAPYKISRDKSQLEFRSAIDTVSGLQFTKRVRAGNSACIEVEYGITNTGNQAVSTAAWEISRSPAWLTFLPASRLTPTVESMLPGVQFIDGYAWYQIDPAPLDIGKKAFFDVHAGWLAHVTPNRQLFIKSFVPLRPDQYSPGHAAIEVYAHIDGAYVELENHGPRTMLHSGQSLSYAVRWYAHAIPADIKLEVGNHQLAGFAQEILRAEKS